jgi:hypothetical protein
MRRKLLNWMMAISAGLFVLPLSTCARSSVNGIIQSITPCDFINCNDPSYINPCMFIQCDRPVRTPTTTTDTDTTTDTTNNTTTGAGVTNTGSLMSGLQ